jgi:hypothetical protein
MIGGSAGYSGVNDITRISVCRLGTIPQPVKMYFICAKEGGNRVKIYAGYITAQHGESIIAKTGDSLGISLSGISTTIAITTIATMAINRDEALGKFLNECYRRYPSADGYSNHQVDAMEIPAEWCERTR